MASAPFAAAKAECNRAMRCAMQRQCLVQLAMPHGVVPRKTIVAAPPGVDEMAHSCCDYTPVGDVVAVHVGDGLKLRVACVEVGPGSNAYAFAEACKAAFDYGELEWLEEVFTQTHDAYNERLHQATSPFAPSKCTKAGKPITKQA